jgi:L-fuconolactonase
LIIIDTHCHSSPAWYEPVESLIFQMDQNGVAQALLVQIRGQYDNEYQFECEQRYPGRFVSVVGVDVADPAAVDQLAALAARGAKGVRLAPDSRSPGNDPLAIWQAAAALGLPVSCGGSAPQFASPEFAALVATLPELPIVIEHLGGLKAPEHNAEDPITEQILALAQYPNTYLKIHGLGEFCQRNLPVSMPFPFDPTGLDLLQAAYKAFGAERIMWGSDFPPVSGREGYAKALRFPLDFFADKPERERALIFGGVAARVFGL